MRKHGAVRESPLRYLAPVAFLIALVLVWQVYVSLRHVPAYLVPAPTSIWKATLAQRQLLISNAIPTLEIASFGLFSWLSLSGC